MVEPPRTPTVEEDETKTRRSRLRRRWFDEHFHEAAAEVVRFIGDDGVELKGKMVADVGCGDGIIDLGVATLASPKKVVGFDVRPSPRPELERLASEYGGMEELPPSLEFRPSKETRLPAETGEFDVVFSWSAFEHILHPIPVLREIRRVLKPSGVLMIQVWPFFHSQNGSHLPEWFPSGFTPFNADDGRVEHAIREDLADDPEWAEERIEEYRTLNRITLDELGRCLLASDFFVAKLELLTQTVHLDRDLSRFPLSKLGIGGVKLLAGHL